MKHLDDIAVIVQARLESERVPNKMIRPFAGTTLLDIAVTKMTTSTVLGAEQLYLAVHEPELLAIGHRYGVNIFHRSLASAQAEGVPLTLLYEWWDKLPFKYAVLINACNPLLTIDTIDRFVLQYARNESDGLFGVMKKRNYTWHPDGTLASELPGQSAAMDTKWVAPYYEAAHCLYAGRLDRIGQGVGMDDMDRPGDLSLFELDELEAFDIDYEWQFHVGEVLFNSSDKLPKRQE